MDDKPNVLLCVVDTQIDFVMADGLLPVPGAEAIVIPGISHLARLDPNEISDVLFTYDTHDPATYFGSPENLGDPTGGVPGFPLHCERGTAGWRNVFPHEIVPDGIGVHTMTKGVFDMWAGEARTDQSDDGTNWIDDMDDRGSSMQRDEWIQGLRAKGVDTVRVMGVAADFCVHWAIVGFLARGFRVEVVERLTAGIARDMAQVVADEYPGRVKLV